MNKSFLGSIDKYEEIGKGANSYVYKCDFKESLFAYKEFLTKISSPVFEKKMNELTKYYYDTEFVFPYEMVYKRLNNGIDELQGYVMDFKFDFKTLNDDSNDILSLSIKDKIVLLKRCRDKVELLHNKYNLVHCDLYPGNFIYNKNNDDLSLIDFDSSISLKDKSTYDENLVNTFAYFYIKNNGIDCDVDIFLFNLCCYSIINNCDYNYSLSKIMDKQYGNFCSKKSNEILDSYQDLSLKKTIKKEYIIDYI